MTSAPLTIGFSRHQRAQVLTRDHFGRSVAATYRFFDKDAPAVAGLCRRMAERFLAGGTLLALGEGAQVSDAHHVAVEFVHPVIVGKRALPALALGGEAAVSPRTALQAVARPHDIALALCASAGPGQALREALLDARRGGLLTVLLMGEGMPPGIADVELSVPSRHPLIVQEVLETTYHVLWELVHVFFEREEARELHPYLFAAGSGSGDASLLAEVEYSTRQKALEICDLRERVLATHGARLADAALALSARLRAGGRLLACGNGGSATDAEDAALDALVPPIAGWQAFPALSLTGEVSVVTAVGNDVGFEHVFARQVIAFGRKGDVALGFSTSGASRNVNAAMAEAAARGLLTIGFSGGGGGELARATEFCITAPSEHLPRIQEAHATAWHAMLTVAQAEAAA